MRWSVVFLDARVEAELLAMPPSLVARFVKKSRKTPAKELELARLRLKEAKSAF